MDPLYRALADGARILQETLRDWADARLDAAGLRDALPVGLSPAPAPVVQLALLSLAPGSPPEIGADFSLMGRWGSSETGHVDASTLVPSEWLAIGRGVRRACEHLVTAATPAPEPGVVPAPRLVPLEGLPAPLSTWFRDQPMMSPGVGWPDESWTVTQDGVPGARLPFLTWYPGFDLALSYAFGAQPGPLAGPALAVLATAAQSERTLRVKTPAIYVTEQIATLIRALATLPTAGGSPDLEELLDAATVGSLDIPLRVLPGDGQLRVRLATELPIARGPRLVPGSTLIRHTAPPRRQATRGRAGS